MPDDQRLKNKVPKAVEATASVTVPVPAVSFARGFAQLLDIAAPPPAPVPTSPPDAATAAGFARTGDALRLAMAAFRGRSGGK
jgi:hypothetical protein